MIPLTEQDANLLLNAGAHVGAKNKNFQMDQYVYGKNATNDYIIRIDMIWDKLILAARAICAIDNVQDVHVIGSRPTAQRAVLKFARYTGTQHVAGRFTPGTFTNQVQKNFREPRLLIVSDPIADHQAIFESRYVNLPVIAFCNTDSILKYVDVGIPCNNKGEKAIGLMWYLLAREVLRMKGAISRSIEWDVMPDLFIVRKAEDDEDKQIEEDIAPVVDNTNVPADVNETFGAIGVKPPVDDWQVTDNWA